MIVTTFFCRIEISNDFNSNFYSICISKFALQFDEKIDKKWVKWKMNEIRESYETHLKNDEKNDEKIVLEKHFFFKERFPLS